jgi:predicted 3-demethylubiquinone-9 3-methyltransferase (glyoxalase superfamily)
MSTTFQRITPFLWFDHQAEEAAHFYVSVFPHSRIESISRYAAASAKASGQKEGQVMLVDFVLDGQSLAALNGGPVVTFNMAVSLVVHCETQKEVDHYWERLMEGTGDQQGQCGWLKDRYGVSWQIVPEDMFRYFKSGDAARIARAHEAVMRMHKLDIAEIKRAAGD